MGHTYQVPQVRKLNTWEFYNFNVKKHKTHCLFHFHILALICIFSWNTICEVEMAVSYSSLYLGINDHYFDKYHGLELLQEKKTKTKSSKQ